MSDFAKLCEGDGTIFLVRWRGRQEGPYAGPAIAAKLAANEIGLLHEIYFEGKWITVRDYITLRESLLRAETQARENLPQQPSPEAVARPVAKTTPAPIRTLADDERNDELFAAKILGQSNAAAAARSPGARPRHGRLLFVLAVIFVVIIVGIIFLHLR